jgi:hypothetical protein
MKNTPKKHMITVSEDANFDSLIKKYEAWSGRSITDTQRDHIFRALVMDGIQDRTLALVDGEGLNQIAIDFLTEDDGSKNLKPTLY